MAIVLDNGKEWPQVENYLAHQSFNGRPVRLAAVIETLSDLFGSRRMGGWATAHPPLTTNVEEKNSISDA